MDWMAIQDQMRDTPGRLRAAELLDAVPITIAIPSDLCKLLPNPVPLGRLKDIVTAEAYFTLRAALGDELDRLPASGQAPRTTE